MKKVLFISLTLLLFAQEEQIQKDTCEVKLKKIKLQQNEINQKMDSIWKILEIDSTLRKK